MKALSPFHFYRRRILSLAITVGLASVRPAMAETPATIQLEAEAGQCFGAIVVATLEPGFSGTGYVTGFKEDTDRLKWIFTAKAGFYDLTIRYRAPIKGLLYDVNGLVFTGKFTDSAGTFREQHFGKVELRQGENTLAIYGGWKAYEIDRVDLTPVTTLPSLVKPPTTLCDPEASPAARALMTYLINQYGELTLSGTIEGPDVEYVQKATGQLPAIISSDMMPNTTASIRHEGIVAGGTEKMIERATQGHIVTSCWHWRSPSGLLDTVITRPDGTKQDARWYLGFYVHATTFDLEATLAHPEGPDYALLLADIDMVAAELRKLAERGIPVLWRPLHEAEGKWFWWGAKGPKPFIQLWRLVHDRITRLHGLHNLIWVYTGTANLDWYPGDDVVDIIGIDDYPHDVRDPLSAIWDDVQARFSGRKLVALSEFGGAPDLAAAHQFGVTWSYFASWSKDLGPMKMKPETLKAIYNDPRVINFSQLPKDRWRPTEAKPLR